MTYGDQLDRTAAALAVAQAALRNPLAGGMPDHAAAAIARTQLYRAIEWQVGRIMERGDDNYFAKELRQATYDTSAVLPSPPPSTNSVAVALRHAADAARTASDIINAQFDPTTGHPRSPDGLALIAGIDRRQNLARLAQLARAASEVDVPLAQWLHQGYARSGQPVVQTAATDAARTSETQYYTRAAATADRPGPSPLHALQPPPLVDTAAPWTTITSPADCIAAIDAARTWLVQHRDHLTAPDIKTLTRTGLALSYEVDYLIGLTTDRTSTTRAIQSVAAAWRAAARAAAGLHSLGKPEPGVGPTVVAAAEAWLRDQLRADGGWLDQAHLLRTPDAAAWRAAGPDLASRLPDIATLLHRGALTATHHGELFEPQMRQRIGKLVVAPQWVRTTVTSDFGASLLNSTSQLRSRTSSLTREAGVVPLPGLHEADRRNDVSRSEVRARLRRAAATPPIRAGGINQQTPPPSVRRSSAEQTRSSPPLQPNLSPHVEEPRRIEPPRPHRGL